MRPRAGQIRQPGTSIRSQGKGRLGESSLLHGLEEMTAQDASQPRLGWGMANEIEVGLLALLGLAVALAVKPKERLGEKGGMWGSVSWKTPAAPLTSLAYSPSQGGPWQSHLWERLLAPHHRRPGWKRLFEELSLVDSNGAAQSRGLKVNINQSKEGEEGYSRQREWHLQRPGGRSLASAGN